MNHWRLADEIWSGGRPQRGLYIECEMFVKSTVMNMTTIRILQVIPDKFNLDCRICTELISSSHKRKTKENSKSC
jgi:hypothetical protein